MQDTPRPHKASRPFGNNRGFYYIWCRNDTFIYQSERFAEPLAPRVWRCPFFSLYLIRNDTLTYAYAVARTYKPDAAARRPDPEIHADPGHHPHGSAAAEQTQNPLFAGAHHRGRGDRPPRPEPRAARQQHHSLGNGRPALHHVPLGIGHGHVRFQEKQLAKPRLRPLHLLRAARPGHPGRALRPGIPDLLLDPARRALRLADAHRLPHRQQTRHRPRQGRHHSRRRHGHHRHAGPAAAHRDRRHGHGQRGRDVLVAARRLGAPLHRHHRLSLPAAGPLVLQTVQRQRFAVYLRAGDGLSGRLPRPAGGDWSRSSAHSSRDWPSTV